MAKKYMTREGGATVTVFVPYDCKNHCPFCINKQEYKNGEGFSTAKVCESIRTLHEITPACDFVFTGGEPFSNPDDLQVMLDCVPDTHRVFINTTLPVSELFPEEKIIGFAERNKDKLTCINVSRHMVHYVEESNDTLLAAMPVPVRVNCVLFRGYSHDNIKGFADRFGRYGIPIQFRADYTVTTPENLYRREGDGILSDLMANFTYLGLDGCRIRCGYHFDNHGQHIAYHRTLPYSTISLEVDGEQVDVLYDVLIKQNGDMHSDWTYVPLDLEAYRHVRFEPYDLQILEGRIKP